MFAVPLLYTFSASLRRPVRFAAWTVFCLSVALQAASTTLVPNVEIMQREGGSRAGVIVNRCVNLVEVIEGHTGSIRFAGLPPE